MTRTKMEYECLVCSKKVERSPSRIARNKGKVYCSKECHRADTVKEERECKYCGHSFLEYPSRVKDNRGHYCSKECADKAKEDPDREQKKKDRDSTKMKKWKLTVLQRDNFSCKKCGWKGSLQIHHILGFSEYPKLRFDVDNGITLCTGCHTNFHKKYGQTGFNEEDLIEFIR